MRKTEKVFFWFLFSVLFIFALVLRFYKLGEIPPGFYRDEAAIGYNAYSILKTGRDEYGERFPVYFKSFGDYKSPVYIYLTAISVKIFGLNEFAVRFPSAFFGFLTVLLTYFLIRKLFSTEKHSVWLAVVSSFSLAITPWHLFYSRATFEVSIALFLLEVGTLFILWSFEGEKKLPTFISEEFSFLLGTVFFILALYSYSLARLLSPLLFFVLLFVFRQDLKKVSRSVYFLTFLVAGLLLYPFFSSFFSAGGVKSAVGTLIFSGSTTLAPILEFKSYLVSFPLVSKVGFNKWILIFWEFVKNFVTYLSFKFLFVSGSSHGNHGIGNFGQFYIIQLPFLILGLAVLIQQRKKRSSQFSLFWIFVSVMTASLTHGAPHATRSFFLNFPLTVAIGQGVISFCLYLKKQKKKLARLVTGFSLLISLHNVFYYFTSYYIRYPVYYAKQWQSEAKALSQFLEAEEGNYQKIVINQQESSPYIYFLFFQKYSLERYWQQVERYSVDEEGFHHVKSFGKYEFREIDWERDQKEKNTLFVDQTGDLPPKNAKLIKLFHYPQRPVVNSIKAHIVYYPVEEIAYSVFTAP